MKRTLINTLPESDAEFSGCGRGPAPAARRPASAPPVFVNGVLVSETEIAREAQNHQAASADEARAAAARALVIRRLLLDRARALGLAPEPRRDERGREEAAEEALARQVLELEAQPQEPSVEECRRVYQASRERFQAPELFEASHILFVADGSDASDAAARASAESAIAALEVGADFGELARRASACPSGRDGGALGLLQRGDLAPSLEDVLLDLEPGAVAKTPVRTRHGWHVVRLDQRTPARQLPFETVQDVIRDALRARAGVASAARYVAALAAQADIEGLTLTMGGAR